MKQSDLIDAIEDKINKGRAWRNSIPKDIIEEVYNGFRNVAIDAFRKKKELVIRDVGTISVYKRKQTVGTHPKTKEKIIIPSKYSVRIKLHKKSKDVLNKKMS
jgi:nucleoid DNA-binding protein